MTRIRQDGQTEPCLPAEPDRFVRPNGIALTPAGDYLLADLGERGGVYHLDRQGSLRPFLTEVDGATLPPTNFVWPDGTGRVWITVSTRRRPRQLDYRPDAAEGFVVLCPWDDPGSARIVADGLGYTNEARTDPTGRWLYVNETFARRLSRFPIAGDGLGPRETVVEFGPGTFPDGLEFDERGGIWIAGPVSNRVLRLDPDGTLQTVIEDGEPDHEARVEAAFQAGSMRREHLEHVAGARLCNISSLAFGGSDRRTVYLGCLSGDRLATFRSPVAGRKPPYWDWT